MREGVATSARDKGEFIGAAKAAEASAQLMTVVRIASLVFMEKPFCSY
jgi:hypothetical protein